MSSIKFSQLQTLANPPGDTIFPVVSSGTNYQISLNTLRLAIAPTPTWSSITGKPSFATVAFSGLWQDIANKPTIPSIPTNVSSFTNDSQYITQSAFTWNNLSSKPGFAAIASSGNWSDVVNKPAWLNSNTVGVLYNSNGTIGWTTATLGGGTGNGFQLTSSTQVVSLDSSGTLHTPLLLPKIFTALLLPVRHSGDPGAFAWEYEVHFVVGQDGSVETQINNSLVRYDNPGYQSGDSYTFTEADHGIPGYSFTITLHDVTHGQAGWTANLAVSPPPAFPSTVKSLGAIKLTANDKSFVLGTNGALIFPDGSAQLRATAIVQADASPVGSTSTLWYDTVGGRSYVYFDNSWVDASPIPTVDTTQISNSGYSLSIDSAGIVNLPTFAGSPSIAIVQTASAGISLNANGAYWNFGQDGTLTVPGDIRGPATHDFIHPDRVNGHTLSIAPASDASDKKFKFRIDQYSEPFTRAYLEMPQAEIGKQVAVMFPHTNGTTGYIFNQGANTYDDGMNNAFNIFYNYGDIKITTETSGGSLRTWKFSNTGDLTLPGNLIADNLSIQGAPVTITITDTGGVWGGAPGTYTRLNGITPPKWAPANYNPGSDSYITYDGGWQLNNPNFGHPVYVNTGGLFNPSATWNPDTQFNLGSGNPGGAYTYNNWTFNSTGSLTFPDGSVQTTASRTDRLTTGSYSVVVDPNGHVILPVSNLSVSTIESASGIWLNANGKQLQLSSNGAVDLPLVNGTTGLIRISGNLTLNANGKEWLFNQNGSIQFPNSSVQTGASISIADLKTIITTCTSFTEFKNAILGL